MTLFDAEPTPSRHERTPIPLSDLDRALTAQLVVAWAGEGGEDKRLAWWRTDLVSEFGGLDLFRRLLPHTADWAVLQGAREAARRTDAELRAQASDADRVLSLYSLGFERDERLTERLHDLKRAGRPPADALPGLADAITTDWRRDRFVDWVQGHGDPDTIATPTGRLIKGTAPENLDLLVRRLVAALAPVGDRYPLPHFRLP